MSVPEHGRQPASLCVSSHLSYLESHIPTSTPIPVLWSPSLHRGQSVPEEDLVVSGGSWPRQDLFLRVPHLGAQFSQGWGHRVLALTLLMSLGDI